jgi:peptide-methionine (S)-S-oxide reductase
METARYYLIAIADALPCDRFSRMVDEETAVLGGGCFWCLEAVFDRLAGVKSVESGYMGGNVDNPSYRQVCSGSTGHAEVVRVKFDPKQLGYRDLLEVFFTIHDPTTFNRQGNDVGTQYRSVIFYTSEDQRRTAEQVISELNAARVWPNPIVTTVEPAQKFFVAEDYHQQYYDNNSSQPYCQFVVAPKVEKFQKKFAHKIMKA